MMQKKEVFVLFSCDEHEARNSERLIGVYTTLEFLKKSLQSEIKNNYMSLSFEPDFTSLSSINSALVYGHIECIALDEIPSEEVVAQSKVFLEHIMHQVREEWIEKEEEVIKNYAELIREHVKTNLQHDEKLLDYVVDRYKHYTDYTKLAHAIILEELCSTCGEQTELSKAIFKALDEAYEEHFLFDQGWRIHPNGGALCFELECLSN